MLWLWNFFLDRRQFSYVLLTTLVIAGLVALVAIPKENFPQIIIPNGFVITTLPGASAADMETLVTSKLEDQISGIANIDTMTSGSHDSVSEINVQFLASADINQSIQDLRDAVAKVTDLPSDASTPQVLKINFSDQPILVASIGGDLPPSEFSAPLFCCRSVSSFGIKLKFQKKNGPLLFWFRSSRGWWVHCCLLPRFLKHNTFPFLLFSYFKSCSRFLP
jgi:hypothetical protein